MGGHDSEGARNTKHHSVIVVLGQAVVHKEGARTAVNIGPGVLDFAGGRQSLGDLFIVGLNKINEVVVLDVFLCELELTDESRVGLSEDGVSIARNNLTTRHSVSHKVVDVLSGPAVSVFGLEGEEIVEALLIGEAVKGASQTVHACGEGQVGVREGRANQVSCVRRNVSAFVIAKIKQRKGVG